MTTISTLVIPDSAGFAVNAPRSGAAAELRDKVATAALGGPAAHRERHAPPGKPLPRDRVRRLLDSRPPFIEVRALGATSMYDDSAPGAGASRDRSRLGS